MSNYRLRCIDKRALGLERKSSEQIYRESCEEFKKILEYIREKRINKEISRRLSCLTKILSAEITRMFISEEIPLDEKKFFEVYHLLIDSQEVLVDMQNFMASRLSSIQKTETDKLYHYATTRHPTLIS